MSKDIRVELRRHTLDSDEVDALFFNESFAVKYVKSLGYDLLGNGTYRCEENRSVWYTIHQTKIQVDPEIPKSVLQLAAEGARVDILANLGTRSAIIGELLQSLDSWVKQDLETMIENKILKNFKARGYK